GDYRLNGTSPLIDDGASQGAPGDDISGNTRPQGKGYDVGPYEFAPNAGSGGGGDGGTNGSNELQNGSFAVPAWPFHTDGQAPFGLDASTTTSGAAKITVPVADSCDCAVQLSQSPVALTAGHRYTLTFSAKASVARSIRPAVLPGVSAQTSY